MPILSLLSPGQGCTSLCYILATPQNLHDRSRSKITCTVSVLGLELLIPPAPLFQYSTWYTPCLDSIDSPCGPGLLSVCWLWTWVLKQGENHLISSSVGQNFYTSSKFWSNKQWEMLGSGIWSFSTHLLATWDWHCTENFILALHIILSQNPMSHLLLDSPNSNRDLRCSSAATVLLASHCNKWEVPSLRLPLLLYSSIWVRMRGMKTLKNFLDE
jgi:hypothetical protein